MIDDFAGCMVSNSRMAARAITRRHDRYLRSYLVTATQLSPLGAVRAMPEATVSDIAEARGFERTRLTRNLDKLEQMGLIESGHKKGGNGRLSTIAAKGDAPVEELLPLWRRAQADMRSALSGEGSTRAFERSGASAQSEKGRRKTQ